MNSFLKKLILTLTIISSLLYVSGNVAAQTQLGKCLVFSGGGAITAQIDNQTNGQCTAKQSSIAGITVRWEPYTQQNPAPNTDAGTTQVNSSDNPAWWLTKILQPFFAGVVQAILKLAALLTGLGGMLLNGSIYYTIVNVSQNYEKLPAINEAWRVIRDVANMGFIFVLLYAAIQTIIGQGKDAKGLIVRTVIVAILINFSLFFTKFIIDISNILALTFYDAMVPGAAAQGITLSNSGLSNAFMQSMNLQDLYKVEVGQRIDIGGIISTGIMGTVMLLIAAFSFFAVGLMFIIRYVVLIIVLILSPIAIVSFVLPNLEEYRKDWWKALSGQAFFAPIYMMLTWVTLKILNGITSAHIFIKEGEESNLASISETTGFFGAFINYLIVIIFLITSLTISKKWADRTPGGFSKISGWAMGFAGGKTIGTAGWVGRRTLGSWGNATANDDVLRARARQGDIGAKMKLAVANTAAKGSFDLRGTNMGGVLGAGKAQKGGFVQDQKDRAKRFEAYKPTPDAVKKLKEEEARVQREINTATESVVTKSAAHLDAESRLRELRRTPTRGLSDEQIKAKAERMGVIQEEINSHKEDLAEKRKTYAETSDELAEARAKKDEAKNTRQNLEQGMENMASSSEKRSPTLKIFSYKIPGSGYILGGKDRAAAIRAAAKGKSNKEKLAEAAAAVAKDESGEEEKPKEEAAGGEEKKEE